MSPIHKARAVSKAQTVLGVTANASQQDIHDAWKKLAFDLHPDRSANDGGALASVNAAYTLLKERAKALTTQTPAPANGPAPLRPRRGRPAMPVKHITIDPGTLTHCGRLIADEPKGHGHVAVSMERIGRKVTYIVETELAEGVNRVAMPVTNLSDPRKSGPTSLAFRASQSGPGTLDVPKSVRDKMFPGMMSVRIRFAL